MPTITFPLEIIETILELLAEDDKDHLALKTCSLVCRAFLPVCRKHIFESIVLNDLQYHTSITYAFERLLRETPEIADYIRKLDYTICGNFTRSSIQESFKRISRLEFLSVRYHFWPGLNWSNNLNPIRQPLLHLLHLPTLTHFTISGNNDFVVSVLIPCVNLEYLDIGVDTTVAAETTFHAALPEHSIQLREIVLSASGFRDSGIIKNLYSARRPDGRPIIDFGSLSKITVTLNDPDEGKAIQELFRRCHALTSAHISFLDPDNFSPSLSDMLRPSMQTLKHIVVNFHDVDDRYTSQLGIPSEFEDMRTKNIIETVTIGIMFKIFASFRLVGDDWGRLDEILTSPGWFSLKRVSLAIGIPSSNSEGNKLEALRNIPDSLAQFPQLSSSNSVSIDINVKVNPMM